MRSMELSATGIHQKFVVDGICFTSMEQFMMYRKAVWFQDHEIEEKISCNGGRYE